VTETELAAVIRGIAPVVREQITKAVSDAIMRVAVLEAQLKAIGDLRDKVVTLEAKQPQPDPAIGELKDRVLTLENKGAQPLPVEATVTEIRERLNALDPALKDIPVIRERLAVVESKGVVPGPAGRDGKDGKDADVAELTKQFGELRERVAVAEVKSGVPGPPGKDGQDGLGFDDLALLQDDERSFTVKAIRGDRVKDIGTLRFPVQIQRGVYIEGKSYEPGDMVTWAGSSWHCNEPTSSKPGEGTKAWTLTVKRGRDGKDGKDAETIPVVSVR
jgi:integrin beta 3